jgi:hypothetical protein
MISVLSVQPVDLRNGPFLRQSGEDTSLQGFAQDSLSHQPSQIQPGTTWLGLGKSRSTFRTS